MKLVKPEEREEPTESDVVNETPPQRVIVETQEEDYTDYTNEMPEIGEEDFADTQE